MNAFWAFENFDAFIVFCSHSQENHRGKLYSRAIRFSGLRTPCYWSQQGWPGNASDHKAARTCLDEMPPPAHLIADKGYDSAALRSWLAARGVRRQRP